MYRSFLLAVAICILCAGQAQAHKALFFAYLEDGEVVCEGGFPGGKACKGCPVIMYDAASGVEIMQGATDSSGLFRFPLPRAAKDARHGLKLVLNGGEGHRAEWLLDPEEYLDAPAPAAKAVPSVQPDNGARKSLESDQLQQVKDKDALAASEAAMYRLVSRAIAEQVGPAVDKSLERKLGPIRRQLAEATDPGPTFTSILGGLGWIVGLAGIVAWLNSRRKV